MLKSLLLQTRSISLLSLYGHLGKTCILARYYSTSGTGTMSSQSQGGFKIYHSKAYRSGRCTWLVEGTGFLFVLHYSLDHCPMPINTNQECTALTLIPTNTDHCKSMAINFSQLWLMPIDADQCLMPWSRIDWNLSALTGNNLYWEVFRINASILIGIGQWSRESWFSMHTHPYYCKVTWSMRS